ncbi:porin [Thiobaca trueperi]|uniref:Putative porin n=1 Tax=Thiobaca trueperi TaxID=127458 RepID=A0A4R3N446_9GAMM|nr:porin [Thiobaca trueperi]TCT23745.1 putative porin [Thiobaca trueperi]
MAILKDPLRGHAAHTPSILETLKTMKKQSIPVATLALALIPLSGASHAVSFSQGDATLDINGTINGFFSYRTTKDDRGTVSNSGITNGLLPGWINFVFTTRVEDLDIKAHVGFAPGINNDSSVVGLPIGGGGEPYSQIDTRNLYFQFGTDRMGTFKLGRDIGLFGQKIILNDMTLLGLGGNTYASTPFNTTFGMIGHGYMYTGFQPQITYTTPDYSGFKASVGVFQPSDFTDSGETSTPGVQAIAGYDWKGSMPGSVWGGAIYQDTDTGLEDVETFAARGFELGTRIGFGNFEATAYAFTGKGLGLSTVGALFFSPYGETESRGYFLQGTYKFGDTKVGINYGENRDDEGLLAGNNRFRGGTIGIYHSLNKYITLVAEYNQERATGADQINSGGYGDLDTNTISLGGIIFF